MKRFLFLALAFCALVSCSRKVYVPVEKTVNVKEYVHDTAIVVQLQQITDTVVIKADPETKDAESHLRNRYCYTDAVYRDGELKHTLSTIQGAADTVIVEKVREVEKVVSEPKIIEVERNLGFFEKMVFWIQGAFGLFVGVLIISFIIAFIKVAKGEGNI